MDEFFAFARERHAIYLRRAAGQPKPWTTDPVLQTSRFTNVFRELDRTTAWFRKHVREPLRQKPEVLLATVIFRWFNRISTGEAIFCQPDLGGKTPFDWFLETGDTVHLKNGIHRYVGEQGPYVTGAYTINTNMAPLGTPKLDGVLFLIQRWVETHHDWHYRAGYWIDWKDYPGVISLEEFCTWVQGPCLGDFMAYEIACDLRHTALLDRAVDINTWANTGPGANRGLNRVFFPERDVKSKIDENGALALMLGLLMHSREPKQWPQFIEPRSYNVDGYDMRLFYNSTPLEKLWPAWELREVEHTLCEYDKYCRVRAGDGQTRGRFSGT